MIFYILSSDKMFVNAVGSKFRRKFLQSFFQASLDLYRKEHVVFQRNSIVSIAGLRPAYTGRDSLPIDFLWKSIVWCRSRQAGNEQVSTGHLHLNGLSPFPRVARNK